MAGNLDTLQQRAATLGARADALRAAYDRSTWYRFALVFFPVPFAVLLFRLQLDYWHYYLAGGGYIVFSMALYSYDTRASSRCNAARAEAEKARQELEQTHLPA